MKAAETTTTNSLREHHFQRKRQKLQKLRITNNSSMRMNKNVIKIKERDKVVNKNCERCFIYINTILLLFGLNENF